MLHFTIHFLALGAIVKDTLLPLVFVYANPKQDNYTNDPQIFVKSANVVCLRYLNSSL